MSIAYNSSIVTTNLGLCLDAGNPRSYPGSGTAWRDVSGNLRNGTLVNGPTYNSSNLGSLVFDGIDDYAQVDATDGFGAGGVAPVCTLSMWANITRKAGGGVQYQQLAGFRNDTNFSFFFLLLDSSGATVPTEARILTTGGTYDISVNYTTFNTWTNIVFVANTNRTDLYFNGTLAGSNTNVTGTFGATSGNFRVGASPAGAWYTLGNMSQVQFYTSALTSTQILQNFNAARGRYGI
jgi:hypothetical protein